MKPKVIILLAALGVAALVTGCSSIAKKIQKLDALGIKELHIPGRVTNTDYTRVTKDGVVTSTLEHSNPWLIKPAVIIREVPETK